MRRCREHEDGLGGVSAGEGGQELGLTHEEVEMEDSLA